MASLTTSPVTSPVAKKMGMERETAVYNLEEGVVQFGAHIISLIQLADPSKCREGRREAYSRVVDKVYKRTIDAFEGLSHLIHADDSFTHSGRIIRAPDLKHIQRAFFARELSFAKPDESSLEAMVIFHQTINGTSEAIIQAFVDNLPHFIPSVNKQIGELEKSLLDSLRALEPTNIEKEKKALDLSLTFWKGIQKAIEESETPNDVLLRHAKFTVAQLEHLIKIADFSLNIITIPSRAEDITRSLPVGRTDEDLTALFECYTDYKELTEEFSTQVAFLAATPARALVDASVVQVEKALLDTKNALISKFLSVLPSLSDKADALISLINPKMAFVDPDLEGQTPNIAAAVSTEANRLNAFLAPAKDFISEMQLKEPKELLRKIRFASTQKKDLFNRFYKLQGYLADGKGLENAASLIKLRAEFSRFIANCKKTIAENPDPTFHVFIRPLQSKAEDAEGYIKSQLLALCSNKIEAHLSLFEELSNAEEKGDRWRARVESAVAEFQDFPNSEFLSILDVEEAKKLIVDTHSVKWFLQFLLCETQYAILDSSDDDEESNMENPFKVSSVLIHHQQTLNDFLVELDLLKAPAAAEVLALMETHKTRLASLQNAFVEAVRSRIEDDMTYFLEGTYTILDGEGLSIWNTEFKAVQKLKDLFFANVDHTLTSPNKDKLIAELNHLLNVSSISKLLLDSFTLEVNVFTFKEEFDLLYRKMQGIKVAVARSSDSKHKSSTLAHLSKLEVKLESVLCDFIRQLMTKAAIPPSEMTGATVKELTEKAFTYFSREIEAAGLIADDTAQTARLKTLHDNILGFAECSFMFEKEYAALFPENLKAIGLSVKTKLQALALKDIERKFAIFAGKLEEELLLPSARELGEDYFTRQIEMFGEQHVMPFFFSDDDAPIPMQAIKPAVTALVEHINATFHLRPQARATIDGVDLDGGMTRDETSGSLSTITADNRAEDNTPPDLTSSPTGVFP